MVTENFTSDFSARIRTLLGNESELFFSSLQAKPVTSIRLNPEKQTECQYTDPVPWCRYGYYLKDRPVFTLDPAFHSGAYLVQEASSMILEQFILQLNLANKPLTVLDLCASPGGKSTHLLSLLHPNSILISNEAIRSRVPALVENLVKWGFPNYIITNNDPADFNCCHEWFDIILCDAPCSGEGFYRKDPRSAMNWKTRSVEMCAARQKRIISDSWKALKPGGLFIYSTCTFNTIENEGVIQHLHDNFEIAGSAGLNPESTNGIKVIYINGTPIYRLMPHLIRGEGFTISALYKGGNQTEPSKSAIKKKINKSLKKLSETETKQLSWVELPDGYNLFQSDFKIYAMNDQLVNVLNQVNDSLHSVTAGVEVAEIKSGLIIPAHPVSQSQFLKKDAFPQIELGHSDALKYLRGETHFNFQIQYPDGFCLMLTEGLPLGFTRKSQTRYNNHYPSGWRIRMR